MLTTFIRKKKWRFIPKWLHPIFYMLFLSLDQLRRATKLQWLQGERNPQRHLRPGRMYLTLDLNSLAIRLILQIGVSGGWGDYRAQQSWLKLIFLQTETFCIDKTETKSTQTYLQKEYLSKADQCWTGLLQIKVFYKYIPANNPCLFFR